MTSCLNALFKFYLIAKFVSFLDMESRLRSLHVSQRLEQDERHNERHHKREANKLATKKEYLEHHNLNKDGILV